MKRCISFLLVAVLFLTAIFSVTASASSAPEYTVYNIPKDFQEKAVVSNAVENDKKWWIQGVDWGKLYSDSESGINDQFFWVVDKYSVDNVAADQLPTLTLPLDVPAAGQYDVAVKVFVGGDFGKFEISLDGTVLNTVDCFGEGGLTFFNIGTQKLTAGTHNMVIKCIGYNAGNTTNMCNMGISRVILSPVGYFKLTNYIKEAVPSNRTEELPRRFVQNMDRDWKAAFNAHDVLPEDNGQLFWELPKSESNSATFTVPLNVAASGKYKVTARLFMGGDFGKFEVSLGGKAIGTVDCYGEGGLTDMNLGEVELTAGTNNLVFKCIGFNESNTASNCNLGIHSLTLTAAENNANPPTADIFTALPVFALISIGAIVIISNKKNHI